MDDDVLIAAIAGGDGDDTLLQSWTNPWTWPVRPPDDRGAWLCACAVFAAGLAAFTIRGARTRLADDS